MPAFTPRRALVALGLAAWAFALLPYVVTSNFTDDEFTCLNHALRMLAGEVPYRDFFEFVPPLPYALAAGLFALTGPSLLAAHAVMAAALALAAWQLADLARRAGASWGLAVLPGLLLCFGLYRHFPAYSHHWLAVPAVLAALQGAQRERWLAAGVAVGVAGLVLQTDGAAAGVVVAIAALWSGRRAVAAVVLGALLPLLPAVAYLAAHQALGAAVQDLWSWPRANYRIPGGINDVPYGSDFFRELVLAPEGPLLALNMVYMALLYLLPPVMAGVALVVLARGGQQRRVPALAALALGAVAVTGRTDVVHIAAYAYPALLLAATFPRAGAAVLPAMTAAACALFLAMVLGRPGTWLALRSPDARLAQSDVIRFIHQHSAPGDTIVGMPWGGFFYFYGRPAASRFTLLLHPREGYAREPQVAEAYEEIRSRRPKLVLLAPEMRGHAHFQLYDHFLYPLPGYKLLGEADMPHDHNGGYPVMVFGRD